MTWKSALILLTVLFLGITIGVLGTGFFINKHVQENFAPLRKPQGLAKHMVHNILKANPDNIDTLLKTIRPYLKERDSLRKKHLKGHFEIITAMEQDLQPLLNEEQKRRLEIFNRRLRRIMSGEIPPPPPPSSSHRQHFNRKRPFRQNLK